jgi:hypothetical protein
MEARFVPFLVAILLTVFAMPLGKPWGSTVGRLVLPVLLGVTVIESIRLLPVILPSPRARPAVMLYRLCGLAGGLGLWIPALAGRWPSTPLRGAVLLLLTVFFVVTSVRLVRLLTQVPRVNLQVLAGAAAGYVHLGLTGGILATWIEVILPGSFNLGKTAPSDFLLDRLTYFSFVTIGSLGYGDVLPANPLGERVAILLSLSSTLYVSLLVGLLLGRFIQTQELELVQELEDQGILPGQPPDAQ